MKRPVSVKIDPKLHDACLKRLENNKIRYRSFTTIVETALTEWLEAEQMYDEAMKQRTEEIKESFRAKKIDQKMKNRQDNESE